MLPFTLTGAQQQAVADIAADMSKPQRMLRLLQGDVGSGKTMVALIAMMQAVDNGAGCFNGTDRNIGAAARRDHRPLS